MTRLFIFVVFAALWASIAAAQSVPTARPGSTASSVPPSGSVPADPLTGESRDPTIPGQPNVSRPAAEEPLTGRTTVEQVEFAKLLPTCVGSGEVILISGTHFSKITKFSAYLESKNKNLNLQIISKNARQMVLKLPANGLSVKTSTVQ